MLWGMVILILERDIIFTIRSSLEPNFCKMYVFTISAVNQPKIEKFRFREVCVRLYCTCSTTFIWGPDSSDLVEIGETLLTLTLTLTRSTS